MTTDAQIDRVIRLIERLPLPALRLVRCVIDAELRSREGIAGQK